MRKLVLLLLSILLSWATMAQDCDVLLSKKYLKDSWHCGLSVLSQPARYDWKDWAVTTGVLTVAGLSFVFDDEIYGFMESNMADERLGPLSAGIGVLGEEYVLFPFAFGLYAISAINKDCRLRTASLAVIQSLVFTEIAVAGVKVLSCRARPEEGMGSMQWNGPFAELSSTSFVSGHTARAFAVAATISDIYNKVWVGVAAYSLATLVACQRLVAMQHWSSDVLWGAAIGYFIGRGVAEFNVKLKDADNLVVVPFSDGRGIGVALKF